MLACGLDVKVDFDIPLTIFSALVAVAFTFAALSSAYVSDSIENSIPMLTMARWGEFLKSKMHSMFIAKQNQDIEAAGYVPISGVSDDGDDVQPAESAHDGDDEDRDGDAENMSFFDEDSRGRPATASFSAEASSHSGVGTPVQTSSGGDSRQGGDAHNLQTAIDLPSASGSAVPPAQMSQPIHGQPQHNTSNTSSDSLSTDDSSSQDTLTRIRSNSTNSHSLSLSSTTVSSNSWNEPLHAGLSRETRLRIKAHARDRPVPNFGWGYWLKAHYNTITVLVVIRAAIWAFATVLMHYSGRIIWNAYSVYILYFICRHVGYDDPRRPYFLEFRPCHHLLPSRLRGLLRCMCGNGSYGSSFRPSSRL